MVDLLAKYCIDTCSIVDLVRRRFPEDLFPELLGSIEALVSNGELVSVREVYRELEKKGDEVLHWAKSRKGMFIDQTPRQVELTQQMYGQDHRAFSLNRDGPDADPWVVAVASEGGMTVVTSENRVGPNAQKLQIPNLCEMLDVPCVNLFDFFRKLGWEFALAKRGEEQTL